MFPLALNSLCFILICLPYFVQSVNENFHITSDDKVSISVPPYLSSTTQEFAITSLLGFGNDCCVTVVIQEHQRIFDVFICLALKVSTFVFGQLIQACFKVNACDYLFFYVLNSPLKMILDSNRQLVCGRMSHSSNSADFELEKYCIVASILLGMLKNVLLK